MTFPIGSIADGFLVARKFWNVDGSVVNRDDFEGESGMIPELLKVLDDGSLLFQGDMSETRIMIIGEMLILRSEGGG